MNYRFFYFFLILILCFTVPVSAQKVAKVAVLGGAYPLHISGENRLEGYLGQRYNANLFNRVLKVDEGELLGGYLSRPGKHRWIGEHVGKYLETAVNIYVVTRNPELKLQMDRIAKTLVSTQLPNGYLGTYLPANYWTSWDVWSHKYNMYGLLAYYKATGNESALAAVRKMADLLVTTFGNQPGQRDILTAGSHVGMAATSVLDPIVELYMLTGEKKYLDFADYIIKAYEKPGGPNIIEALKATGRVDKVANAKAYEMLSNILGIARLYRVTKNPEYLKTATTAFDDIVRNRLYITGSTSDHERFQDNDVLKADTSADVGEGCVTTTWLQLNQELFSILGDLKYVDEIEKTIYNQLLASENPSTGCVSYFTPLIGVKPYSCHITCCLSSVPRGIALIPYINYGRLNGNPTLLLHESAQITDSLKLSNGKMAAVIFQVKSTYPEGGTTEIKIETDRPADFTLQVRIPEWTANPRVFINGKEYASPKDELLSLKREWKNGDLVKIDFEVPLRVITGGKSYPDYFALKKGAQVLTVDESVNGALQVSNSQFDKPLQLPVSSFSDSHLLPSNWIGKQAYQLNLQTTGGNSRPVLFTPFSDAGQLGGFSSVWIKAN